MIFFFIDFIASSQPAFQIFMCVYICLWNAELLFAGKRQYIQSDCFQSVETKRHIKK